MREFRVNDLKWTWSGDLTLSKDGDLDDTFHHHDLLSLVQEAKTRIRSSLYDWRLQPHLGASLDQLSGEPNGREIAETGKMRIISALSRDNLVAPQLLKVQYMPIDRHHILYRVKISPLDLQTRESIEIPLLLGTDEFTLTFM